ncbi:cytoplasmic dynein 2 heavy chain 1 isoform X2 [Haliaeetus albicilla]|uniref:cytoplasmic dynein 2 heavy chain 1 isoform X2 n=1 Tax=Haliaeetus albicilla TaxID=8969 RepID=UPI0037E933A3
MAGEGDKRKRFISATAANYFGLDPSVGPAALAAGLHSRPELTNFLDDGNEFLLVVQRSGTQLTASNKIEATDSKNNVLVFFKLRPDVITEDNLHSNILVSSMLDSPINTLYQAVRQVFAPVLLKDERWSKTFEPKLQKLLSELEAGLSTVLRRSDPNYTGTKFSEDDVRAILTPTDEFQFWIECARHGSKWCSKERASHFKDLFEDIAKDYYNLDSLSLFEVVDLVETTKDTVDGVWRQTEHDPYPQPRMHNLLDVIGGSLGRYVQRKLAALNLWEDAFHSVKENLKAGILICEQWVSACEYLTGQLWQRYTLHPWKNEKYFPESLAKLGKRLDEVLTVRTLHEKLTFFLPAGEQNALHLAQVFEPFVGLNPVHCNPYTEPLWKAAVSQYERIIAPAEQKIASKLKKFISEIRDSPQQLLQTFQKYKELIKHPNISKELLFERETLLAKLQDYVKEYQTDFETRCHGVPGDVSGPLSGKNLSEVVNNIVWVRQLELKVDDATKLAEALLSDLPGFQTFHRSADSFLEQLKVYEQEQFDDWSRNIQSELSNPKLGLCIQANSPVMELDHVFGTLNILYSDRLVTLLREVRQLSALGFAIPAKIQNVANTAQKFCKQAVILKQVAHFYNSIDQQMIASQKPMMLQSALAFEQIIKHSKSGPGGKTQITWDNPRELEAYIQKLQAAAERLSTENRKLRKWHTNFIEKVISLMNIDLLRQQQRWKDGLQELRTGFASLESQGFRSCDMKAWRQHWNHQLYKALEHQYQMGLEALNENLPEINIDLTFKQGRLQFRPPFEEVRARYYREMKRFISIPNQFRGVSEAEEDSIFTVMTERNADGFLTAFSKAEDLFRRLTDVSNQFKEWIIIGQVDMETLVKTHLYSKQDWEKNFKALKVKGKEAERLPSTIRIDCLTVNCNPVKNVIDDFIQKLYDVLVISLRKSIQAHLCDVSSFLTDAMDTLVIRPQTVEEVAEDNLKYLNLHERKEGIFLLFQEAEDKNKLLRTVAGAGLDTICNLRATWDKFELMMESHQLMITEQIEMIKGNVISRINMYLQDLEKFKARWDQLKPSDDVIEAGDQDVLEKSAQIIKEKKKEFDELETVKQKLIEECHHFKLEEPDFSLSKIVCQDIKSCAEVWTLYEEFYQGFQEKAKEDWITFRSKTYLFEEFLFNWHDRMRKMEEHTVMTVKLQKEVDKYKMIIPLLKYLRGEHLSPDHWLDLFRLLGLPRGTTLEGLLFGDLLKVTDAIIEKAAELKDLNCRAQGEVTIREALRELELWGVGAVFTLTDYEDSQGKTIKLIKDWKDIVNQVGDHRCLLQSLKDSAYYKGFEDKVSIWEKKLAELDEYLQNLNQIQRKWVYLEPIFGRGALPKEQARFNRVDEDFRSIMSDIKSDSRITSLNAWTGIRNTLITILDQLQRCQRSLNEFLEEKRLAFPRFYFIGDDDLLEILGQSTNPLVIQSHLKKLFAGINSVSFDEEFKYIVAMKSVEGETVPLRNKVLLSNDVEVWLNSLALEMKETLKKMLIDCVDAGKKSQGSIDPSLFPSQILSLAEQIQFTEDVESAIKDHNLQQLELELMAKLEHYTSMDTSIEDNGSTESGILELKLKALILDIIHNIDVVKQLNQAQVHNVEDWAWKKQLRFYIRDQRCYVQMVDAELQYTYEYQGNSPKLVYTPLTDKCYLTLTQAMKLGLGGNPYGPAGTGKTESVKALGGLLGRQVLVFNCDEGIDVKSMGRIFVGLVKCGAWGCFDEFNRLEEAVLSAVSMQIQTIQHALKKHTPVCEMLGKKVEVDHNSGIFITLNPAGKGYGGRQKLPDNLKQLFRPVAMTHPDNELIAEVILYSEGFKDAKILGRKLVAIFSLARELLTPQQHYDWGLRALKTVLKGCGSRLHQLKKSEAKQEINESHMVVQALRLNTMSKLTFADCARFDALVKDVFPGIDFKDVEYAELTTALQQVFEEANLEIISTQIKKALELYEQLRQRMGVVIVGPSGGGKSTLWRMLKTALGRTGKVVKQYTMNPKAMPRHQLLGHIDMDTREWSDGVLTNSARQVVREPRDITSWIICDGDIDPEWIESLNSVLDDNRLLTMPSGERIQFGSNVNFIFETHDLSCASPATISRMGMIFLSDEDTDLNSLIKSWLRSQPEKCRYNLENWIGDYFEKALNWVVKKIFTWAQESPPDPRKPLDTYYDTGTGQLMLYQLKKPENLTADDFSNLQTLPVIQTPDMQRGLDYFRPWLDFNNKQPFLLVGPEGCGKGMLLHYAFSQLRSTQIATIHCSAQTTSQQLLQKLNQTCIVISTNTGRVYRPKDCERLVLYLKDINLPKPDKWGTSTLVAFLQQVLTYQGFYDENLEWVGLENIQIVASMSAGGTLGRHKLTSRFTSIVRVCAIDYPERDQLQTIYSAYLEPVLQKNLKNHPVWGSLPKIHQLAGSMVQVYEQVRAKFTVDDYSHYLFTPRILTQWVLGLFRYDLAGGSLMQTADYVLEIVAYEAHRLFRDKIVGMKELHVFDNVLMKVFQGDWGSDVLDNMADIFYVTWGACQEAFITPGQALPPHGRPLGRLTSTDLKDIIQKGIIHYGRDKKEIEILLFQEVLSYMSKVDRVLSFPGGSLLLAGRSGVGRRTVTSLVSHMHGAVLITPKISRGYELKQFKNDLKYVMELAGIEAQQVVLLLEDYQFVHSTFLEMINSLLSSGEVPGLYKIEELEPLLSPLKDQASQDGFTGPIFNYFTCRIQQNLHVVLIMDSTNLNFTINCESNPALYKKCQVLWMETWSENSMKKIPEMLLYDSDEQEKTGKAHKELKKKHSGDSDFLKSFLAIHESCKMYGATPSRYMTFLHIYSTINNSKRRELIKRQNHLQAGVSKLNEAKALVDELNRKAGEQSILLKTKQDEADAALQEITVSMQSASEQKTEMEKIKHRIAEEAAKIEERKRKIEDELKEVQPLVNEAKLAVGNIKPESLSEIRSLRMPPDIIRDILEGVLRLMGIFDTSWVSMKSFLAKRGVREDIATFDARNIPKEIRESVEELLSKNRTSFDPKNAKRASAAAAPLAAWVNANVQYSHVLERIQPLEKEKAGLESNLKKTEDRKQKLEDLLNSVGQKVSELKDKFQSRTTEAAKLEAELSKAQKTLKAAEVLINQLDREHKRWSTQVSEITDELATLPKRAQLAAAFITYLSAAPEDRRKTSLDEWTKSAGLEKFDLRRFLCTESEELVWKSEGLPSDDLSIENALVILQSKVCPFLIDPSFRATEWLKTHLKESRLEVINQQDTNFLTALELAVRFGKTLIIQEMDGVEPVLYPLLRKDLVAQGPRYTIQIGEKKIDYNEEFRLFLSTRNPNPFIPPDASSIVTEVNFTTTGSGLRGQLLALTIQHEKPDLEEQKTKLLQQEEDKKIQLAKLEESLLETLATSQGNILENKDLIESLNQTKASSALIQESLAESHRLQSFLDKERDAYLPLAESASKMYFIISDLSKINNMYRFSLAAFLRLFQRALQSEQDSSNTEERIKSLIGSLKHKVYEYVCRCLFKADQLMFALHFVRGMHPELFQENEWETFTGVIIGDTVRKSDSQRSVRDQIPSWIEQDRAWAVASLKISLPGLYQTLCFEDEDLWHTFSQSSVCEQDFPSTIVKRISLFQQVLVVQAVRPDRLQSAMAFFACKTLGIKELSPSPLNLKRLYKETLEIEPILIIISPGADPSQELQELASVERNTECYHQIAMGQGQADLAIQTLKECARNGEWLCLKNLHLVTSWLPVLEKELNTLQPQPNFRLWLTAEVHQKFTPILLQSSLKITYEAPPGLKKNLLRTYESWTPEQINKKGNLSRAHSLFCLAWFHAVCQERRNYIPQGWTKFYEFSLSDLRAGFDIIDGLFEGSKDFQWEFVHGLFENAIYGGRVDNYFDMRVLRSYLEQLFNSRVIGSLNARGRKMTSFPHLMSLPNSCSILDYRNIIESLPEDDKPDFFGLPANIARSSQRIISAQVISQLRILSRSVTAGCKFDREIWSTELSPVLNLWKKLNQNSNLIHQKVSPPVEQQGSPILSFVTLEQFNAIRLVQSVHQSLASLSKVIRGTSLLSSEVQRLASALLNQKCPVSWQSKWEGPEDPLQYLRSLVARALAIQNWVEKAEKQKLLSDTLDLSELFHPDTFLNALRQETARIMSCSVDSLKFTASWKGRIQEGKLQVKISGLQLEGCSFDGNRLSENLHDSPSVSSVLPCYMAWIPQDACGPYSPEECISLPVYTSVERDRVVTNIDVPCGGNQDQWIQCGAALFLKNQ